MRLFNKKGMEVSYTVVGWVFAILFLLLLLLILGQLKGKQFSLISKLKSVLFFRGG